MYFNHLGGFGTGAWQNANGGQSFGAGFNPMTFNNGCFTGIPYGTYGMNAGYGTYGMNNLGGFNTTWMVPTVNTLPLGFSGNGFGQTITPFTNGLNLGLGQTINPYFGQTINPYLTNTGNLCGFPNTTFGGC